MRNDQGRRRREIRSLKEKLGEEMSKMSRGNDKLGEKKKNGHEKRNQEMREEK